MKVNCPICDSLAEINMVCENMSKTEFVPSFHLECKECGSEFGTPTTTKMNAMINKAFKSNDEKNVSDSFPKGIMN